ncbi:hypothetical protein H4R19_005541 [Coemansia spiralis]|nr:hypothetical protein H4R19_005541 [Coemansia spiralis]
MELPQFPKPGEFGADARVRLVAETGRYVFTNPGDGAAYEFDDERAAWFPMWNESLVEEQQSAYGTTEDPPETGDTGGAVPAKRAAHRAGRANTSVYVSGLPRDATAAEVAQYFAQCGAIMPDLATNEPRVRLYCDGDGAPKGDALVTYFKAPSVRLALDILDDSQFRATSAARIRVEEVSGTACAGIPVRGFRQWPR